MYDQSIIFDGHQLILLKDNVCMSIAQYKDLIAEKMRHITDRI